MQKPIDSLLQFLDASPTPHHAIANIAAKLRAAGYAQVGESDARRLEAPVKCYFTRNDSSLVALNLNRDPAEHGFRIVGAHTDSPCLKVKPNAISVAHGYAQLGVEVYGGALLNPWFDRDLGLAGRVTLRASTGRIVSRLIDFARPVAFIPNLAIHLNREANAGRRINAQKELPAVLCRQPAASKRAPDFEALLIAQLRRQYRRLTVDAVLAFELSLYDRQPAAVVGLDNEFIAAARLDNLLSCYVGAEALCASQKHNAALALNDHEEVGSVSSGGADGPFLRAALRRCCADDAALDRAISRSMLASVDNAHGVHPNYADKHESQHAPQLNAGPVIKVNANQRYATDAETAALFRHVCEMAGVPVQTFVARADMACGSTIGPITAAKLGLRTVDIGAAQLGMHSIRELAGAKDPPLLTAALKAFYNTDDWPF